MIIDSWEAEYQDDWLIDIYVGVDNPNVGPDNFDWKSEYALARVEIDPNTDEFRLGRFYISYITKLKKSDNPQALKQEGSITLCAKLFFKQVPSMKKLNPEHHAFQATVSKD